MSWAMTYPLPADRRDEVPDTPVDQVLWECFRHFVHLDESNAAIHCSPVRYSPITFRLAEQLHAMQVYADLSPSGERHLVQVMAHLGRYPEDRGRIEVEGATS